MRGRNLRCWLCFVDRKLEKLEKKTEFVAAVRLTISRELVNKTHAEILTRLWSRMRCCCYYRCDTFAAAAVAAAADSYASHATSTAPPQPNKNLRNSFYFFKKDLPGII